jgi:hypothetical protein
LLVSSNSYSTLMKSYLQNNRSERVKQQGRFVNPLVNC